MSKIIEPESSKKEETSNCINCEYFRKSKVLSAGFCTKFHSNPNKLRMVRDKYKTQNWCPLKEG